MNSKLIMRHLLLASACIVNIACVNTVASTATSPRLNHDHPVAKTPQASALVIATWNVEHLADSMTQGCRPRDTTEIAKLQNYAQSLNADIVALQEVASADAVTQIFPEEQWQVYLSDRPDSEPYTCRKSGFTSTQQKVAFAVRKGIDVINSQSASQFGLDLPGLRYGMELTVASSMGPMTLLNVHMKSGCFVDNYSRAKSEACQIFARQAPLLDAWVEQKEQQGMPYVVLGDFNHRLSAPYNHLTRQLLHNSDGSASDLVNTTANVIGCHPWYPALIDHILVGNVNVGNVNAGTVHKKAQTHLFADMNVDTMLSDHCAVSLRLSQSSLPLSNAVKWQTLSQEYRYITRTIYQRATERLQNRGIPNTPWVVVMDIDETVMDNSAYQVNLDQTGTFYSSASWAKWIEMEQATLVPGAKSFMQAVLQAGGKLALVTNRQRVLDHHTWRNMLALGIPLTQQNTCLIGRAHEDEQAVEDKLVPNDKDLRRRQIESGSASCYKAENVRHTDFASHQIVMQVGDNIEDFAGVTQEHADIDALLRQSNGDLVLLPNPMYGSWR